MPTADPTLEVIRKLKDPSQWDRVTSGVPIFIEHERKAKTQDGKEVTVKVDKARLEAIMRRIHARQNGAGVVLCGIDGHSLPTKGTPQQDQPKNLCLYANPRMGRWGKERKLGILVDEFVFPGKLKYLHDHQYLFRSPEFYARELGGEDDIRSVALLKTQPFLDMGMITYEQEHKCCLFYAFGEDTAMPVPDVDDKDKKPDPDPDPARAPDKDDEEEEDEDKYRDLPPSTDGLDQGRHDEISRYMKQHGHHLLRYMQGCGAPGATKDNDDEAEQYMSTQKTADAIHYGRLEKRLKAVEEKNGEVLLKYEREVCKGIVLALARDHGVLFRDGQADKIVSRMAKLGAKEREELREEILLHYEKDPAAGQIPEAAIFAGNVESGQEAGGGDPDKMSDRHLELALQYQRDHDGVEWDEAVDKTRGVR